MKKLLVILFVIGLAVFLTWDNEEKQIQKERNVQQVEENIRPYLSDKFAKEKFIYNKSKK